MNNLARVRLGTMVEEKEPLRLSVLAAASASENSHILGDRALQSFEIRQGGGHSEHERHHDSASEGLQGGTVFKERRSKELNDTHSRRICGRC